MLLAMEACRTSRKNVHLQISSSIWYLEQYSTWCHFDVAPSTIGAQHGHGGRHGHECLLADLDLADGAHPYTRRPTTTYTRQLLVRII